MTDDQRERDENGESAEGRRAVIDEVARRIQRKKEARESKERGVWFGLGMFGLVGWSVALPTIIGLLVGLWIDRTFETGRSWTLALLLAGIATGCFNAWYWVRQEYGKGVGD